MYFTFHNVSIKSGAAYSYANTAQIFTFHNVSIKSRKVYRVKCRTWFFTFHNVSIKSVSIASLGSTFSSLHSTMYLLNHTLSHCTQARLLSLHSTMYLLNLGEYTFDDFTTSFTFHNVSIKSRIPAKHLLHQLHLYIPQCIY